MRRVETVMGIPMSVDIREVDDATAARAAEQAFAVLRAADARFSRYRQDSEVSAIVRGERGEADASPELREVIGIGERARL
ncbi:FAD:protein FMN transferase, partial [uncultured Leifsonia sp.]|uniref:FAD:protein FMN transferase n=1 Tax=uncultured Leifsonia sp. TaxID=340359 RepID=UPI0028D0CDDB